MNAYHHLLKTFDLSSTPSTDMNEDVDDGVDCETDTPWDLADFSLNKGKSLYQDAVLPLSDISPFANAGSQAGPSAPTPRAGPSTPTKTLFKSELDFRFSFC